MTKAIYRYFSESYYAPTTFFEAEAIVFAGRCGVDPWQSLTRECPFSLDEVADALRSCTGCSLGEGFYIKDPDNCLSLIDWVKPLSFVDSLSPLISEFRDNLAEQGGNSYLGIHRGDQSTWLLSFELCPENDFHMVFYGEASLVAKFHDALGGIEYRRIE